MKDGFTHSLTQIVSDTRVLYFLLVLHQSMIPSEFLSKLMFCFDPGGDERLLDGETWEHHMNFHGDLRLVRAVRFVLITKYHTLTDCGLILGNQSRTSLTWKG